jgi:diguanylate cyclase (GGDEF)-like protein
MQKLSSLAPLTQSATPAQLCLLILATGLPIYSLQWLTFHRLLAQPDLAAVTWPAAVQVGYWVTGAAALFDVAMALWIWPRRHAPDALPRATLLISIVHTLGLVVMGVLFGPYTSPVNMAAISSLLLGLALLERRAVVVGFIISVLGLVLYQLFVMAGRLPYSPVLVPGTFVDNVPSEWWRHWRDVMFFSALVASFLFMGLLFSRLDRQRRALEELSRTDALTGLANRRHFMERLDIEMQRRNRYSRAFCVVLCDADHFKKVNDTYGHHAGDDVLRAIGRILANLRRPPDVAARFGGEEFALLLPETTAAQAAVICERLRAQLEAEEFTSDGRKFRVTISMGGLECRRAGDEAALKAADLNLYSAKAAGRNRVVLTVED